MNAAEYWTWWWGGLALGVVALAHPILTNHLLAVSGIVSRTLSWRSDEKGRSDEAALAEGELDAALMAATFEEFGETIAVAPDPPEVLPTNTRRVRLPISTGVTLLLSLALGGFLSTSLGGEYSLAWSLGTEFEATVRSDILRILLPLLGGGLVGFGASMAGGCTSGHGLSGCARFQPGSLVATMSFFAGGIVTSQLLRFFS